MMTQDYGRQSVAEEKRMEGRRSLRLLDASPSFEKITSRKSKKRKIKITTRNKKQESVALTRRSTDASKNKKV